MAYVALVIRSIMIWMVSLQPWILYLCVFVCLLVCFGTCFIFCLGVVVFLCAESLQLYLIFCDPGHHSPTGSSVHGILQASILEWGAISFSRETSLPRDRTGVSCIGRQILYHLSHQGSPFEGIGHMQFCEVCNILKIN